MSFISLHISSIFCPMTLCFAPVVLFAQLAADALTLSYVVFHKSLLTSNVAQIDIWRALFLPSTYACFIFSFTPLTHIRLVTLHRTARCSLVFSACLNKQFSLGCQVALGKIITITNTVGHGYISIFNKWLLDKALKSICNALWSVAGSSGRRRCLQLWNQRFPAEIKFLTNDLCHLVLMSKGNTV